ncbi:GGDEF domain-containing protein [Burkholderia sp. 22PA0099]|uniref:GGDEF domain-containing protein n=1 Tax=Burkholderia sp. 22PA0099 TaxID=3237372 RepID=UPI0039C330CA
MPNPTVALVSSAMMSLLLLALLGSLAHSRVRGVREWMASNLVMALGLSLMLLRGHVHDVFVIVPANLLMAVAATCFFAGCARFMNRQPGWPAWLLALIVLGGVLGYWRFVVDNIQVRVFAVSMYFAATSLATVYAITRPRQPGRRRYPYLAIATLAAFCAAMELVRGFWFLHLHAASSPALLATPGSVILSTIGSAVLPMLSMAAMMLVHDELLADASEASNRDYLTGLLSRKRFELIARNQLKKRTSCRKVALLLIDFDYFKAINDVFGHAGGDAVLRDFAVLALENLRADATFGRVGGEEFGVLLPGLSEREAWQVGERLRIAVAAHTADTPSGPCRYTISGGVAVAEDGDTLERLYVRADRALYDAKQQGRNAICTARAPLEQAAAVPA